jgi:DNA-binding MarR family transcriptional regulator
MAKKPVRHADSTDDMADKAFFGLIRAYGHLTRVMQPFFGRYGISGSQWGVLMVLNRARREGHGRLRMADFSERLFIRPPSVTGVVDRLERQGLLQRHISSSDLRTKEVSLTPAGEELVNRVLPRRREQVKAIMRGLSAKEQKELVALLGRFLSRLAVSSGGKIERVADINGELT